jgi:hypothetical protein
LLEGANRAGAIRYRRVFGLAASGDLNFPALPLLVGLRLGQGDDDPASARVPLKVFEADSGQFRAAQAAREPDQDQGPVPDAAKVPSPVSTILLISLRLTAPFLSCFVPVVLRMLAFA